MTCLHSVRINSSKGGTTCLECGTEFPPIHTEKVKRPLFQTTRRYYPGVPTHEHDPIPYDPTDPSDTRRVCSVPGCGVML